MEHHLSIEDAERKFLEDLEKAKALSLEEAALDRFRQEKRKGSLSVIQRARDPGPLYAKVEKKQSLPSKTVTQQVVTDFARIKPRPRPGSINTLGTGLVPPPLPPRRQSSTCAETSDLINLRSPEATKSQHAEDTFLQELDLAIPPQSLSTKQNRSAVYLGHMPSTFSATKSFPVTPTLPSVSLMNQRPFPASFDESLTTNKNLIDLGMPDFSHPRFSILNAFDPLLSSEYSTDASEQQPSSIVTESLTKSDEAVSQEYDPFDYFLGVSQRIVDPPAVTPASSIPETIYEVLTKEQSPVKPSTGNKRQSIIMPSSASKSKDTSLRIIVEQVGAAHGDVELNAFANLLRQVRSRFKYDDPETNPGFVTSPMMEFSSASESISVKIVVHLTGDRPPIVFTSEITNTVDLILTQAICDLSDYANQHKSDDHVLKVWGRAEFLVPDTRLGDYEYVHDCIKLEKDVELCLVHVNEAQRPLLRTQKDDVEETEFTVDDLLSREPADALTHASVSVLLDTIHGEMERLLKHASPAQSKGLFQSVKALCSLLGSIETTELSKSIESLMHLCKLSSGHNRLEFTGEDGPYSMVVLSPGQNKLKTKCVELVGAIRKLMDAYTQAFRVDFALPVAPRQTTRDSSVMLECVGFKIGALHRLDPSWNFDTYEVQIELLHGVSSVARSQHVFGTPHTLRSMFNWNRIVFDETITFDSVAICTLPRESRLVLTVYGTRKLSDSEAGSGSQPERIELGWTSQSFFRYGEPNWRLVQGGRLLPLWPPNSDKRSGFVPTAGRHPRGHSSPILSIELPELDELDVIFPSVHPAELEEQRDFSSLDDNSQKSLMDIVKSGSFGKMDLYQRELLWEKRHYLTDQPGALTKILQVVQSWDWASLADLYGLLRRWKALEPLESIHLFLPCFPDVEVRRWAVEWLRPIKSDELIDYLGQLVEALKLEPFDNSPLMLFLIERSLGSPQVAHSLYWHLVQQLPGPSPQNSDYAESYLAGTDPRYSGRLQLLLRSLLATCGNALRKRFLSEQMLVQQLDSCADLIKNTKDSQRMTTLTRELEPIHALIANNPTSLPIGPSLLVNGLDVRSCSFFTSFTTPLKLVFTSAECEDPGALISAMYKVGDDLRQDMLTLQMVRIMDKLWRKNGLDLKMVTFSCVPTGPRRGFVELVTGAETLRRIQIEHGLTGSFKDRPIADWLAKHNPSPLEYERAVDNFTSSCAGYSVATYVFGVCDRHNDNIMVKSTGHLFHIDFGKFLGDAQMFGNFKRDRTPFVLTSDMAYVINGGDKPSQKFQHFVDICCQAFNVIREHSNDLLHLLALMATSNIPGVNANAISYVQKALLPNKSNAEAAAVFARMIEDSLRSWFVQFNFFLHNLAQLRFHGDANADQLLSFVPKTYTAASDGRILEARVVAFQKRYDPEKYYVYIVRVEREKQSEQTYLFRSHREFSELHQKLCLRFPLVSNCLPSLTKGVTIGRSSVKVVAEKRRFELDLFLLSLFDMADEIRHCELVYTFFHPLLRDQDETANVYVTKWRNKSSLKQRPSIGNIQGELKLSIQYTRGELHIMIQHARDLNGVAINGTAEPPSPYVKTYLLPDPHKMTKRKTRIIRRNIHPTFMEMLVYRLPLEQIQKRLLQVSVWSYDRVQENQFLGAVNIPLESLDLSVENVAWHPLGLVQL